MKRRPARHGQVLVMFALSATLFIGVMAIVIDVGNLWNASLQVQRAAEAAALAGVPHMPGDFSTASTKARDEAKRNGFSATKGDTIVPAINAESNRRLDVLITRPYATFFLRMFGVGEIPVTRSATAEYTLPVPMGSPLSSYGDNSGRFWGAAESQGSNRSYGDAYGPFYNPPAATNTQYDATGYQYAVDVPVGAGATTVDLYDATFCAVDDQKGTGDHWIPWNQSGWPAFSIYYTLWSDPALTPLDYSDDVVVASSGSLFESKRQADRSTALRESQASYPSHAFWSLPDCQADIYHNRWWTLATLTTPGEYRLQVTTTNAANVNNQKTVSAENMWGLRAVPTNPAYVPHVYGLGKMVIYANATAGTTVFYLGRIPAIHAGKTIVIQLFDPGDAQGTASIQILKPTTSGYVATPFSYTADSTATGPKSGTNVSSLVTVDNDNVRYNNSWVTITVPLAKTYNAPRPTTEAAGVEGGWWKIRYTFSSETTDTTTWQVSIRGNPVHLIQQ
jgi:hypothetical protein